MREATTKALTEEYEKLKKQLLEFSIVKKIKEIPSNLNEMIDYVSDLYRLYIKISNFYDHAFQVLSPSKIIEKPATSLDLMRHYQIGQGQKLSLNNIGMQEIIPQLIKQNGALGKTENRSIHSDFLAQIANADNLDFKNSYDFGIANPNHGLWAIGGATISGEFILKEFRPEKNNKYLAIGFIDYNFYDKFSDPYDLVNAIPIDIEFGGTPYEIQGKWREQVQIELNSTQYEKLKHIINIQNQIK